MAIHFVVLGRVVPQSRPRFGEFGVYDAKPSKNYKKIVKETAIEAMQGRPPLEGPLRLKVKTTRAPSRSWKPGKKQKCLNGEILPTSKPDVSNLVKGIEDALNGIVWQDDAQIVEMSISKVYDEVELAEVIIEEINGPAENFLTGE